MPHPQSRDGCEVITKPVDVSRGGSGGRFASVCPVRHTVKKALPFPAAGYRNNSSGTSINNVSSNGNCWSSSANSSTNARNLNLNSGNFNWNNNNRAYGFSLRPVVAITVSGVVLSTPFFNDFMVITEQQIRDDLYQAYYDARRYKRNTLAQLDFEDELELNLEELFGELVSGTYVPLPAFCFITFDPVQREVFASQFRDRVVQHMLYNYLAPLIETLLIYDTYSCRVGKGTHFGMQRFCHHIRSVTDNYRHDAYVLMVDLSGYFMSIDKQLLMDTVMTEIYKHLDRRSPDGRLWSERIDPLFCEWLMHCFLDRSPADGCIHIGDPHNWDGLPLNKRLECSPEGVGIVIGDIISQLFSNVILNITDQWAKREKHIKHWGHYVDDHYAANKDLTFLHALEPDLREAFYTKAHVVLHPHKIKYVPANGGNQFLGTYVRPYYQVPRQRTVDKFVRVAQEMEYQLIFNKPTLDELELIRARINSYCGILSHYKAYNMRQKYLDVPAFKEYFVFDEWITKGILKPAYMKDYRYWLTHFY